MSKTRLAARAALGSDGYRVRLLIATGIAGTLWLFSLAYFGVLLSSNHRPQPPRPPRKPLPLDMRLVELPPPVAEQREQTDAAHIAQRTPMLDRLHPNAQPMPPARTQHVARPSTPSIAPPTTAPSNVQPTTRSDHPAVQPQAAQSPHTADVPDQKADTSNNNPPSSAGAFHTEPTSRPAQLRSQPLPALPDDLREQAYQAAALARFVIHPDGTFDVELVKPTPYPRLNGILLEALRKWQFTPATENGRAVESRQQVRVHFDVQ
ncbi:energy transducer TonB [Trinickia acidisoli]|uniref:energy transducer TonB n=1 Tax=Trinickia acidisoli TaxID=2767482 RepID=UPI002852E880|nr:TonB family protein [Trinickia acidisoli]